MSHLKESGFEIEWRRIPRTICIEKSTHYMVKLDFFFSSLSLSHSHSISTFYSLQLLLVECYDIVYYIRSTTTSPGTLLASGPSGWSP